MSSKVAKSVDSATERVVSRLYDGASAIAHAVESVVWATPTATSRGAAIAYSPSMLCGVETKAQEANRQIDRLRSLSELPAIVSAEDKSVALASIISSISLISSFISGPVPIPIAAAGTDFGTTLFFNQDDLYGDLEIRGRTVEYFLKSSRNSEDVEIFDSEEIIGGYIPPKLLGALFSHYARQ